MSNQPEINVGDIERALRCATWVSRTYGGFGVLSFSSAVAFLVMADHNSTVTGIVRLLALTIPLITIGCAYTRHSIRLTERVLHLNFLLFTIRNLRDENEVRKFMDKVSSAKGPAFVGSADQSISGKFLNLFARPLKKDKRKKDEKYGPSKPKKQKPQSPPEDTPPKTNV